MSGSRAAPFPAGAAPCVVEDDVIDVGPLRDAIRSSPLIGESQLVGAFAATRGFGVACHKSAVDDAIARVPWLGPFLDVALDDRRRHAFLRTSLLERALGALLGDINALYVNVLVVPPGGAVDRHVDSTLGVQGEADPVLTPRAVAVLYVDVPDDLVGGELRLFRGDEPVASVTPRAGRFVLFRGELGHEVTTTTTTAAASSGSRVSCVCELYALPRDRLARLPLVRLQSHGFADVLARLRR